MRRSLQLLDLLRDGTERSGADLARELGVTRAAVWNQVSRLREEGIDIQASSGRGYRLPGGFEPIDPAAIARQLDAAGHPAVTAVDAVSVTDSTNQRLLERAARDDVHGCVLFAEYQTAGRGRRGDRWIAPPGSGLCFSVGWRFESPSPTFSGLSLVVGLSIVRTLRALGAGDVMLKWPNDVIRRDGKLAGILIEMRSEAGGPCVAVIGIGLNVRMSDTARARIDQPVGDVESAVGAPVSRNVLATALLSALASDLATFEHTGFAHFRDEWISFDAYSNQPVRLDLPDRAVEGIARGVDEHGALLIDHGDARERFMTGHLRRA